MHRLPRARLFTSATFSEWRFDRSRAHPHGAPSCAGTLALLAGQLIAMAWAFEVIAGLPRVAGPCSRRRSSSSTSAAEVARLGMGEPAPAGHFAARLRAGAAAGLDGRRGWDGLRAAAGPSRFELRELHGMARRASSLPWSSSVVLRLARAHPEDLRARSAKAARWAALGNAGALALFAFVPALFGMAMRGWSRGSPTPSWLCHGSRPTFCRPGWADSRWRRSSRPRSRPPTRSSSCWPRRSAATSTRPCSGRRRRTRSC